MVFHCIGCNEANTFRDNRWRRDASYLAGIHLIEIVLNELNRGIEIGLIEFVGNVPAEWPEFTSLLHDRVQEGHGVQQRTPFIVRV